MNIETGSSISLWRMAQLGELPLFEIGFSKGQAIVLRIFEKELIVNWSQPRSPLNLNDEQKQKLIAIQNLSKDDWVIDDENIAKTIYAAYKTEPESYPDIKNRELITFSVKRKAIVKNSRF